MTVIKSLRKLEFYVSSYMYASWMITAQIYVSLDNVITTKRLYRKTFHPSSARRRVSPFICSSSSWGGSSKFSLSQTRRREWMSLHDGDGRSVKEIFSSLQAHNQRGWREGWAKIIAHEIIIMFELHIAVSSCGGEHNGTEQPGADGKLRGRGAEKYKQFRLNEFESGGNQ